MHKQSLANARNKLPQASNSVGVFSLIGYGYLPPSEAEKNFFSFIWLNWIQIIYLTFLKEK